MNGEIERLRALLGPYAHCRSCGSLVVLSGEHAWVCDCDEGQQRLGVHDPEAMSAARQWLQRARYLEQGIRKFLDEGVQRTAPGPYASSKHNQCPHGRHGYEGCETCTDEYFTALLAGAPSGDQPHA